MKTTGALDPYLDPDSWIDVADKKEGLWWPEWAAWLGAHSGKPVAPPQMGSAAAGFPPLQDAPGSYVMFE